MLMKKHSLQNKITTSVILIVTFFGISVCFITYIVLPSVLKEQLKDKGKFIARSLSARSVVSPPERTTTGGEYGGREMQGRPQGPFVRAGKRKELREDQGTGLGAPERLGRGDRGCGGGAAER
jgi:hypothetical protein